MKKKRLEKIPMGYFFLKLLTIMKLSLFIVCLTAFSVVASESYSQSTKLSLEMRNVTINNVLKEIEDQSEFRFFYSEDIDTKKTVSVNFKNSNIADILDEIFEGTSIIYKIVGRQIALYNSTEDEVSFPWMQQQPLQVKGKVTDSEGIPLPGVAVVVKGTTNGIVTDINGEYLLSNITTDAILQFSFVGMRTQEIAVARKATINVTMTEEAIGIDEVVAVGYGTQSRRKLTSSITKIDGEALANIPISSIGEGLKGKISGARIYSNNNTPGAEPIIRIRGGSSINGSNSPLILIDGVERSLTDINPNDIESVEVLKDAASTAIYGSRASNGIILVTTKTGTFNKAPTITCEVNVGTQMTERNYDYMNAKDYISYMRPALSKSHLAYLLNSSGNSVSAYNDENSIYTTRYLENGETVPKGYKTMPDPLDESKTLIFQDNNFQNEVYQPALWQNFYLGINGGNENIKYLGSIGYTDDDGVAIGTDWTRFSIRGNVDANISKKIKISTGMDFTESKTNEYANQYNVIIRGMSCPPTQRIYWDDGTPTRGYNSSSPNPVWYDYYVDDDQLEDRIGINTSLVWNIFDGMQAHINGSYFNRTWQRDYFQRANEFSSSRTAISEFSYDKNIKFESYANYHKVVKDDHSFSAVAGYSYTKYKEKELYAKASGANSDKVSTLNAAPTKNDASTTMTEETLVGCFGRLSYDYKAKYLFSATFRADGSSRFANRHQWGYFPGVSAGWIISEESFMGDLKNIDILKFRTSYGQTGNNAVGLYDAFGEYSVDDIYDGNACIRSTSMANQNLTWETSTQLDLGIDLGLLENRIMLTTDYFNKKTRNLLFSKELPNTSGYSSVETNIGSVKFCGFEVELSTINIKKNDFSWNSKFNWSFVKNKVLKLPDNGNDKNRIGGTTLEDGTAYGGTAEGEPLYRFYGYKVDHILQTEEEADNALYDERSGGYDYETGTTEKGRKFAGDYEWVDRDGNDKINSYDQFKMGVTVPHSTGGLGNTFQYKNWSCNIYLDWALGHSVYDQIFQYSFMGTFEGNWALSEQVKQTWKESGDNAKYARFTAGNSAYTSRNYHRTSDAFTFKADYLCIREVSLGYSVPANIIKRIGFKKMDIYFSGNNLHYFTKLIGLSPEVGASTTYSSSYHNYPPIRKLSLGIKLDF